MDYESFISDGDLPTEVLLILQWSMVGEQFSVTSKA